MGNQDDLYGAIGEISARHAMLDEALEYFYNETAPRTGGSKREIEQFMFSNKLDLLAKMMKEDPDDGYRRRVEAWINEARIANTKRNEAVHSTYPILENDKLLGPTKYLQEWKKKSIRRVANVPEMHKLATKLSVLVAHLSLLLNLGIPDDEWKQLLEQLAEAERE